MLWMSTVTHAVKVEKVEHGFGHSLVESEDIMDSVCIFFSFFLLQSAAT